MKILVAVALLAVVISLGKGLYHLTAGSKQSSEHSAKLARALTVRIALSIVLFLVLMAGWYFGIISPHEMGQ
nr:MAG: twin transmembrane helix small protein [Pseudomonadota bacterium]